MKNRFLSFVILSLVWAFPVFAQLPDNLDSLDGPNRRVPMHMHSSIAGNFIDGSQHPELIPDSIAYRLFLTVVAEPPNASEERKPRQKAFLRSAGLDDNDIQAAIPVLATFKVKYRDLIETYNQSVVTANARHVAPDLGRFRQQ